MRYFWLCSLAVMASVPAAAQPPMPDRKAMYEDVEVMRRLLGDSIARARPAATSWGFYYSSTPQSVDPLGFHMNRRLAASPSAIWNGLNPRVSADAVYGVPLAFDYGFPNSNTALFSSLHVADRPAPTTDGTYLKGVGAVLTITLDLAEAGSLEPPAKSASLSATCARCHGATMDAKVQPSRPGAKPEPVDAWDITLRKVRGEKEPAPEAAPRRSSAREEICIPGALTELVLSNLADYGHRFRELPANEALTVVVSLKGAAPAAEVPADNPAAQARSQAEEQLALADLHAKQGKPDEAIRAYQKAIDVFSKPLRFADTTPYDQAKKAIEEATKVLRSAHGKLAQAMLAAGKLDEAKAAIEAAKTAGVRVEGLDSKKAAAPPKPPMPTKLTVRLTKQAIDSHKAGKTSASELRAAADVEAIGFPRVGNPKK